MYCFNRGLFFILMLIGVSGCATPDNSAIFSSEKCVPRIALNDDAVEKDRKEILGDDSGLPALPVVKLRKGKRSKKTVAVQVLLFDCRDFAEVDKKIGELKESGFNTLIFRVFQNRGDRFYSFADKKSEVGVYFSTDQLPVVDDILGEVARIAHKHSMDIFAWMTTRYADYGKEERPDWRSVGYDLKNRRFARAKGLNLFNRHVRNRLSEVYTDLAGYDIDGILFQDDLILRHTEGFSYEARKAYSQIFGCMPDPEKFYKGVYVDADGSYRVSSYGDEFWQWSKWKNRHLLSFAEEIMETVREVKPHMKFALNLMYEAAISPRDALAWLSQDLEEAAGMNFDFYALMVYHRQIGKEMNIKGRELDRVIALIVERSLQIVNGPEKVLIKMQIMDWNSKEVIPYDEVERVLKLVLQIGGSNLAFVPYKKDFDFKKLGGVILGENFGLSHRPDHLPGNRLSLTLR